MRLNQFDNSVLPNMQVAKILKCSIIENRSGQNDRKPINMRANQIRISKAREE